MATAEENIYNRLASAPTFHPVTADLFVDDWGLDAGDVVSVKSGETTYNVPIYNLSLDWHGNATAQIQSTGNQKRKPLPALKRRQYGGGRSTYYREVQKSVEYERIFEATDRRVTSTLQATGVLLDENGNPVMVYNPETGEYEYAFDTTGEGATLASRVQQTAGALETEVTQRQNGEITLQSSITQTASQIRTEVANNVSGLQSQITQNADSIEAEVSARQSGETQLRSTINQTASQIRLEVANEVDGLDSRITVNADAISSEVTARQNADTTMQSSITQNADAIRSEVTARQNGDTALQSSITQNADKIALVVTGTGENAKVSRAAIVTAINEGGASSVDIEADQINLTGYVTATTLDTRLLNADALFSNQGYIGTIRASNVHAGGNIVAEGAVIGAGVYFGSSAPYTSVGNAVWSFGTPTSSDGQISIPWTHLDGTAGTPITFNIADTAYYQDHVGIASTGSWVWDSDVEEYTRVITANDGTDATIGMPLITVYANTPSTPGSSFTTFARVNGGNYDISPAKFFYLQASGDYVYVTTNGSAPTPGTNVVAQLLNPSSGTGGIASLTPAGWTWANNTYTNTVTATANDGTSDTVDVGLPTITCQVGTGTSSNATIRPYGPDNHIISTGTALTLYLKSDDNYVYLTNTNAQPTPGGSTVVAQAANTAYDSGKSAVTLTNATWATSDTSDHNTVSVSTTGRPTTLTTSEPVYLTASGWASGSNTVYLREDSASGTARAHLAVAIPDPANYSSAKIGDKLYSVSYTVGGKSFTYSSINTTGSYNAGWTYGITDAMDVTAPTSKTLDYGESVYISVAATNPDGTTRSIVSRTYVAPEEGSAGGIATVTAAGWSYSSQYQNIVTATANDGTTKTATVTLPTITCDVGLGTSSNATVRAYGPTISNVSSTPAIVSNGLTLYLKAPATNNYEYIYLTNTNATPTTGTNVVARLANPAYTAGYNAAPVGLAAGKALVDNIGYTNDASVYDGWEAQDTLTTGSYKYRHLRINAADGSVGYAKIHADGTYDAGAASVGFSSGAATYDAYTDDKTVADGWTRNQALSMAGYKYRLFTVTASNDAKWTMRMNATATYNNGWNYLANNGTSADYAQFSGSSAYDSALTKTVTTITGYIWLKNASGTWVKGRQVSISTGATKISDAATLGYQTTTGVFIPLQTGKLFYHA